MKTAVILLTVCTGAFLVAECNGQEGNVSHQTSHSTGTELSDTPHGGHEEGVFWSSKIVTLAIGMLVSFIAMIVLPIAFRVVDDQIGYLFLAIGGAMLALALSLGVVTYENGDFIQLLMHNHAEGLHTVLGEPWMLLTFFFVVSFIAVIFEKQIEWAVTEWSKRMSPAMMIAIVIATVGALGSISVVAMATVGGVFFDTLQRVTKKQFTPGVVVFSAAIGISALLTTFGEPLSLFIARNLGEGTPYLIRTFTGGVIINVAILSVVGYLVSRKPKDLPETGRQHMLREAGEAKVVLSEIVEQLITMSNGSPDDMPKRTSDADSDAKPGVWNESDLREMKEAIDAAEEYGAERRGFHSNVEYLLHSTAKLFFFVIGLLLFGEAVKPIAAEIFGGMDPKVAFFGNAVSGVADNALLGLLEVQPGMAQATVFILGISLAFWGVSLVPGNVCNIVLKEKLHIRFGTWAKYGIPLALFLCAINFVLVMLGAGHWLTF